MKDLVGEKIVIAETEISATQAAEIIAVDASYQRLVARLCEPRRVNEREFRNVVLSVRHEGKSLRNLAGEHLVCNLTFVPTEQFKPSNPFDVSWWRGGDAAVTSIRRFTR